jgi:hypothetical protein
MSTQRRVLKEIMEHSNGGLKEHRNPGESQLVDDLVCWVTDSGVQEADEFLSRYHKGRNRCLLAKDVITAMKELSSELGISPVRLGTHGSIAESPRRKERSGWQRQVLRSGALASPLVSVGVDSRFQLATRSDE